MVEELFGILQQAAGVCRIDLVYNKTDWQPTEKQQELKPSGK